MRGNSPVYIPQRERRYQVQDHAVAESTSCLFRNNVPGSLRLNKVGGDGRGNLQEVKEAVGALFHALMACFAPGLCFMWAEMKLPKPKMRIKADGVLDPWRQCEMDNLGFSALNRFACSGSPIRHSRMLRCRQGNVNSHCTSKALRAHKASDRLFPF